MSSAKPYIGCKIGLISKAQNRYEGILYTIDKVNSTVVLAKVKCFGTEGRPTDRPTAPKDDIYEYITFRGSDIKDITLCEPPRSHHGLPPDPAIVQCIQSSSAVPSGIYPTCGPFSPLRMTGYNQLAASSLLNQQYNAALGLGPGLPGFPIRRGPMVEKAVQTLHVEQPRQWGSAQEQDPRWVRRRLQGSRGAALQTITGAGATRRASPGMASAQQESRQQSNENRLLPRRRQGARRRRSRRRGQLMVASVPSATLKFDTDFDFDLSNAQFKKEELETQVHHGVGLKGSHDSGLKEESSLSGEDDHFGPKFYYDKTKSFFDNISSDMKYRLTWAEERKWNLETFGVPGRFLRGQGFRGGLAGRRGRGTVQAGFSCRSRSGQV
ncbi:protein LSM14 homolog B [Takifugu flavidus]|uniref:Protein LSM14-like protein B n=1 Tax=Takifugu flavidus TaxID=433684 RepID=A0A5C6MQ45_9TELE|nr:protein LSM14 homolog B [Takifugu flavidus]TWW56899.1 Protein LSM14 -like protein B [Takifugu flavidus]